MNSDPNIFYGGDLEISESYPTAGDFIIKFLKLGENRNCLVGSKKNTLILSTSDFLLLFLIIQINGITSEIWTFKKVLNESKKMAKILYDAGIRQNDVISIISENNYDYVAISFATLFLNAILAPINSTYTDRKCFC